MVHVEYWETDAEIAVFRTEKEALAWIRKNCTTKTGEPYRDTEAAYYRGERVQMWGR